MKKITYLILIFLLLTNISFGNEPIILKKGTISIMEYFDKKYIEILTSDGKGGFYSKKNKFIDGTGYFRLNISTNIGKKIYGDLIIKIYNDKTNKFIKSEIISEKLFYSHLGDLAIYNLPIKENGKKILYRYEIFSKYYSKHIGTTTLSKYTDNTGTLSTTLLLSDIDALTKNGIDSIPLLITLLNVNKELSKIKLNELFLKGDINYSEYSYIKHKIIFYTLNKKKLDINKYFKEASQNHIKNGNYKYEAIEYNSIKLKTIIFRKKLTLTKNGINIVNKVDGIIKKLTIEKLNKVNNKLKNINLEDKKFLKYKKVLKYMQVKIELEIRNR